jgi:hypothetical protein
MASFFLSVYSSWKSAAEADRKNTDLQTKLTNLQDASIKILSSQVQGQDQSIQQYKALLETQRTTGQNTIDTIGSSAETLRTRVDSSIDLLNQTGVEVRRAANLINQVSVSFEAYVPWDIKTDKTDFDSYRTRLQNSIERMRDSQSGAIYDEAFTTDRNSYTIYSTSSLLPNSEEPSSTHIMRWAGVTVELYKTHLSMQDFEDNHTNPDLAFTAFAEQKEIKEKTIESLLSDKNGTTPLQTLYNFGNKKQPVSIRGNDLTVDIQHIRSNGTIRAIPDLFGAQMLVRFDGVKLPPNQQLANVINSFREQFQIGWVRIKMSNGREFNFDSSRLDGPHKDKQKRLFYIVDSFSQ